MQKYTPTVSQKLILMDQMVSPNSAKYNIGGYAILNGGVSVTIYKQAVKDFISSQEVFSTLFRESDGEFEAIINSDSCNAYDMETLDYSERENASKDALSWMEREFSKPFDIKSGPLFKFCLIQISEETSYWFANVHHLIADGWSFMLLFNGIAENYSRIKNGVEPKEAPLPYSEYARDDREYYNSESSLKDKEYWLNEFSTISPQLFRPLYKTSNDDVADASTLYLDVALSERLQKFADSHKVSLYQLVLSTLLVYFGKRSGHDDITIGMPVLNRSRKVYRKISGVFMNLLAVKFDFDGKQSFDELLTEVKGKMREVLRHQRYQYGNLLKEIGGKSGRKHLYDVRISYESFEFTSDMEGLNTEAYAMSNMYEEDPLSLYMREYHGNGFDIRLVYNKSYFTGEEIDAIKGHLLHLFTNLPEVSSQKIEEISVIPEKELEILLQSGRGATKAWPSAPFFQQWKKVISHHGERIAVSDKMGSVTYHELNDYACSLLKKLLNEGVKPGDRIGIMPSRDRDLPASMLACLLGGFTYVPLDPEYPVSRLTHMWEDSGSKVLLKSPSVSVPFTGDIKLVNIVCQDVTDELHIPEVGIEIPSYIIYTSGSTGKPKGVLISTSSLLDYVWTFLDYFDLSESDKIVQQSAISFDTSVEEIFPILFSGGELHILEDRRDLDALASLVEEKNITILSTNPQAINYLSESPARSSSLRILISGGDVLKPEYLTGYSDSIRIFNTYGPTESTVCASYQEVFAEQRHIPIGKAIANRELIILDNNGNIVPFNTAGELHIGGKGLAIEYVNLPEVTTEKFIKHPWRAGEKLYRTGDMAKMSDDGTVEFLGRIDDQLSLRGYRIEAKEVELAVRQTGLIKDVIIDVKESAGMPVLGCWYISTTSETHSAADWQQLLEAKLPAYMIPSVWVHVQEFPLLPNGKVDKKRLDIPVIQTEEPSDSQSPLSEQETKIAAIWKSILNQEVTNNSISFFQIGGHSLTALQLLNKLKAAYGCEIAYKDIFENPTIASQVKLIKRSRPAEKVQIQAIQDMPDYPLTRAQQRLWVLSQLEEASDAYHISGALRLKGQLDQEKIKQAITGLLKRHESLRTVFSEKEDGEPRQEIKPLHIFDEKVFSSEAAGNDDELKTLLKAAIQTPFSLTEGPLFRVVLIRKSTEEYLLVYVLHHIIGDGWSMEILFNDFIQLYNQFENDRATLLPAPKIQYKDYVVWDTNSGLNEVSGEYWKNRFSNGVPVLELPVQHPRPSVKGYKGKEIVEIIPAEKIDSLKSYCEHNDATLFMGLFAALNTLLSRYSRQNDIVIGTPVANRKLEETQNLVGLFLNILPVRTEIPVGACFNELIKIQKKEVVSAFEHDSYPIDQLIYDIDYKIDPSRSPLFDVMIVLHNQAEMDHTGGSASNRTINGLSIENFTGLPKDTSQFDIVFSFLQKGDAMSLSVEYNTEIFEEWFIRQIISHFNQLINSLLQFPETPVKDLDYFTASEREAFQAGGLVEWPTDNTHTTLDSMLSSASEFPDNVAVQGSGASLSYKDLVDLSEKCCAYLQKNHTKPGDTIAVSIADRYYLPALVYGIWMAGGVYVPINKDYPELRRKVITEDAGCHLTIGDEDLHSIKACTLIAKNSHPGPEDVAYILYTSGTTGKPKGVPVSHAALSDKLQVEVRLLNLQDLINTCLITNYSFDVSLLELFLPAYTAGTLLVPELSDLLQHEELVDKLITCNTNILQGTPTFLEAMFRYLPQHSFEGLGESLKIICSGGESLTQSLVELVRENLPEVRLNNHYGPTEITIDALVYENVREMRYNAIGKPMPNTSAYLFDRFDMPVPHGVPGELYIGGYSLASGYLNKPEQTKQQFIKHPYKPESKLYKTGDLASSQPDGTYIFHGRADEQVKIRGMRVELDEISRQIESIEGVNQAVVICHNNNGNTLLLAFVTLGKDSHVSSEDIRKFLSESLPDHMVPNHINRIDAIPLNGNGKINKPMLINMVDLSNDKNHHIVEPGTETENILVNIWEQILGKSPLGTDSNFFDHGGNSILLVRMRAEIRKLFGLNIEIKTLFHSPLIKELAPIIDDLLWLQRQPHDEEDEGELIDEIII
ncbi:amino acid adenylation domain-containing protein [Roseivirga sp. BDSF3-8]|uniref:amino acid adenylation domain-containing protein n=1 Tax=Roseivirga sp. BDSF3-8 TaxID=3241598 RepID=UPI003531E3E0